MYLPVSTKIPFSVSVPNQLAVQWNAIILYISSLKQFQNVDYHFCWAFSKWWTWSVPWLYQQPDKICSSFCSGYFFPCNFEIFLKIYLKICLKIRTKVLPHPSGNELTSSTNTLGTNSTPQWYLYRIDYHHNLPPFDHAPYLRQPHTTYTRWIPTATFTIWSTIQKYNFLTIHNKSSIIEALIRNIQPSINNQLLLLLKKVGSARLGKSDVHPISPKTPAPKYQPIDRKKRKGKRVEDYSRDRAA